MTRPRQVVCIHTSSCRHECAAARFLPSESNQSGIRRNCARCESYHWMSFVKNGQSDKRVIADLDTCLIPKREEVLRRTLPRAFGKAPLPHWQPVWNEPIRSALRSKPIQQKSRNDISRAGRFDDCVFKNDPLIGLTVVRWGMDRRNFSTASRCNGLHQHVCLRHPAIIGLKAEPSVAQVSHAAKLNSLQC